MSFDETIIVYSKRINYEVLLNDSKFERGLEGAVDTLIYYFLML